MIILDSTFLIDLIRSQNNVKHKSADNLLKEMIEEKKNFSTTFVNVYELYKGAYRTNDIEGSLYRINEVLNDIDIIENSEKYYKVYGRISAELERKGTPIGKFDELVAAIVLYNSAKLITNNSKDFEKILPPSDIINH
ncbi:type II toxin-antitoxin system VapC family toxin [Methanoplanus endosymbiosus]|uniref:Type II toxin-antitoxin system VapC family toxin n=1 Tax=Methanoplanus endosymbiosus TaxID=33865 RepID=A0A9E7TIH9_9EURY|nr:type II toxin-antitoxin system VapC family toxin [Methanoplanus endosymbiosus]UUX92518.1 type II toxin-antitoxin system VapC family toxin [Methanoplanus endosymbiosus]